MKNLYLQGWFYVLTGLWPLIHMRSFERVSGPKTDKWLVYTVSLMILCSGLMFVVFNDHREMIYLALMNAACLAAIDIIFSVRSIIRKVYLLDAVVELLFIGWHVGVLTK